ncbi:efflux RND transporter periplasmic adaptor subunit [Tundrisphaera lichenicola]|uniref:efflux RND transporter periplasmic adaptor subunit n=1 Tax=Tundrisphaera lichenicola TaxID=2029860 RepID=UPI003EBE3973
MNFSLQTGPEGATPPPSGPTGDLPSLGQPSRRRPSSAIKAFAVAVVIIAVGAVAVLGVPGMKAPMASLFASSRSDVITAVVRPGKLSVIVKEKGNLESAANKDVVCEVEGGTTIIRILPEGTRVKSGDVVCELDSASLRDTLNNQKITTQQADASYKQALLTREVAEYAVKEYVEGVFKQDKATIEGQIALAKSDLERAIDRVRWSDRVKDLGYVSIAANIADHLAKDKSSFELEQNQTKLDVLMKYTKDKTIKELTSEVQKAKADELSKQSTYELEKTKEAKLEKQIKACVLKAPGDGIVVYANEQGRMGQNQLQIEEGATVRERQKIFSLPDTSKMRVNTKVHESMVDRIKHGLRALIRVDAAANVELRGQVDSVAPMADAGSWMQSDVKVYTTFVAIEGDTIKYNLRPGMSAQVEILVEELDDVLSVPVQAILQFKNKNYIFIKDGDGFRREVVELGISNDQHVEVKNGLKAGDQVAMTPNSLLTESERREAFSVAAKDAAKKDFGGDPAAKGGSPNGAVPGGTGEATGKGEGKAKAKGKRGGAGGGMGAMGAIFQNMSEEDRAKLRTASSEEKIEILKKAGATDAMIEQMQQMQRNGGPGGPGGGGGGGFGGGGAGGPGQ